jgi:hypothetical protein
MRLHCQGSRPPRYAADGPSPFSFGIPGGFYLRFCRQIAHFGFAAAVLLCFATQARAISCLTESQMTNGQRAEYIRAMRALEAPIQAGNVDAVKTLTISAVATNFDGIAQDIQTLSGQIQGAAFTVTSMYLLNASDVKPGTEEAQFFCSVGSSQLIVTITIPQLPAGIYLLALTHATGVDHPQQVSMILQQEATPTDEKGAAAWKLAGFFVRPMTLAGRDGQSYWTRAREFDKNKQEWNAFFYYQTAAFLLTPVDFLSSPNLEKLHTETAAVRPSGLPGQEPMKLDANGKSFNVTGLRADAFSGQLDLVVNYKTQSVADPVAARTEIIEVMKALLAAHPELRIGFHGLWVYADAGNERPFAIEMAMADIK